MLLGEKKISLDIFNLHPPSPPQKDGQRVAHLLAWSCPTGHVKLVYSTEEKKTWRKACSLLHIWKLHAFAYALGEYIHV